MCLPPSTQLNTRKNTTSDAMPAAAQTDDIHVVSQDNSKGCDSQAGQQSPACSATAQDTSNSFYGKRVVFYNVAENKTEPELLQLFSQHGVVADMFIVRSGLGTSSGCGYVTFATDEQASAALRALQGSTDCAEYGTSLGVLLIQEGMPPPGSNSASRTSSGASSAAAAAAAAASDDAGSTTSLSPKAAAQLEQTKSGKAVFFTKVPPTVTSQQLIQLFSSCGDVAHLELFIPWPGAKISRGCGLVEFACSKAAAAAVHSLHQLFTWPHSHSALVVEWVDRNRQSNNSKGNKGRAGHGAVSNGHPHMGSPGNMGPGAGGHHHMRAVDQQMGAAGAYSWRPAHAGAGHGMMPHHQLMQAQLAGQQGRGSNSCPLPQLPPGWQVVSTSQQLPGGAGGATAARVGMVAAAPQWTSVPTSLSNLGGHRGPQPQQACALPTPMYLQQQQQQAQMQHDGSALGLQQQQLLAHQQQQLACSSDGNTMSWLACPATTALSNTSVDLTSYASLGSVYDASMMGSSNFSSTANSAANSGVLQAGGQQQQTKVMISAQDLSACSASPSHSVGSISAPMQYQQDAMMAVPAANGATMAAGGAAATANGNDAIYQQLLQQHVLLFQNMTPPSEDEGMAQQQQLLLPTSAGVQQQAGMLMTAAGGLGYAPMSQAQQLSPCQVVYSNSSLPSPAHQQQTGWWSMQQAATPQQAAPQQQQQVPVTTSGDQSNTAVLALPLSHRQLAAMAGVLPEVHKLTGAQAWISTAANGGLQLCLSGNHMQLNNGHAAVATLLSRAGVEEQLATPMVLAAAN